MNRLILIGNGFDLAHGMETSYMDFIKWYIKQAVVIAANGTYSDDLIIVKKNYDYGDMDVESVIDNWVADCFSNGLNLAKFGNSRHSYLSDRVEYPFLFEYDNILLQNLIKHCSTHKWVDVESIFYSTLLLIIENVKKSELKEAGLSQLNISMNTLIKKLQEYLEELPEPYPIEGYKQIISEPLTINDFNEDILSSEIVGTIPKSIHILNFNYTSTVQQYINDKPVQLNYIHGQLKRKNNPVIFGFGDEIDKNYSVLEEEKAKGCLDYIKSFWYFRTDHYKNLIRFVESDQFQVYVLGHSCGLSDRTMLHMIFEHNNCASIKIFYHGTEDKNNYVETTHEISRHFKDKAVMRERIVSLPKSQRMPQHTD